LAVTANDTALVLSELIGTEPTAMLIGRIPVGNVEKASGGGDCAAANIRQLVIRIVIARILDA
jgi:hypothetical protein